MSGEIKIIIQRVVGVSKFTIQIYFSVDGEQFFFFFYLCLRDLKKFLKVRLRSFVNQSLH